MIEANIRSQTVGPILGFIIAMTVIIGGIWLISQGKSTAGLTAIIVSVVSLAGVFVVGKIGQGKELAKKARAFMPPEGANPEEDAETGKLPTHH